MSNKIITTAILAVLTSCGFTTTVSAHNASTNVPPSENTTAIQAAPVGHDPATPTNMEKCYGIAKAHQNDCGGNGGQACAGSATIAGDKNAWVYVPSGLCNRIVGGSTKAPNKS